MNAKIHCKTAPKRPLFRSEVIQKLSINNEINEVTDSKIKNALKRRANLIPTDSLINLNEGLVFESHIEMLSPENKVST